MKARDLFRNIRMKFSKKRETKKETRENDSAYGFNCWLATIIIILFYLFY
jgi:hypothetical protein